jgi:hypothetical protein
MSVFFNGRKLTTPQSASLLDDSGMFNPNISVGNVAALIGRANGGEPFTALRFGSAAEAAAALKGDDVLLKAIEKCFDPSSELTGPQSLVFIRVNPATQAGLTLKDGSNVDSIVLASTDYGRSNNQIKVKVESASIAGKKLTTQLGNAYYSADNIARNAFDVLYAGAGAAATLDVDGAAVTITVDTVATVISLVDFPTVQELVDRINAVPGCAANVLDGNGAAATLMGLDFAAGVDVKAGAVTVTAHLQACVDWFNGTGEGFITATRATGAGKVPANIGFTYLSNASDGTVTMSEWQQAFDVLQTVDAQWITPLTETPAVHAMADTHCSFMSNTTKFKRRAICGASTGMTDAGAVTAAKAINSDRTSYTHLGIYDYAASTGKLVLFPAYVAAAAAAGAFAGANPGTALTNKSFKFRGLERKLRNPTDTDQLIDGGVLCFEDTDEGIKCVKSISTWLTNDNFNRVEQSTGFACDFTLRNVQEAVDGVRGKKGNPRTLQEAIQRAESRLKELSRPEPMGPGVLVGDDKNPPFRKLTGSLEGDVIRIEYECSPVIPANFILQVAHAIPYSGSASA